MPEYRRDYTGGTYFFTVVAFKRQKIMLDKAFRTALRESINETRKIHPFTVDAWVLLPDHLHCIWTLPDGDADFSTRWQEIKLGVTRRVGRLYYNSELLSESGRKRGESTMWQRRFWEQRIKTEDDFGHHMNYVHFNPVKHGLVQKPSQWEYSSFKQCVEKGLYEPDWGESVFFEDKSWGKTEL